MRLFPAQPLPNRLQISVRSCETHTNTDTGERRTSVPKQSSTNRSIRFVIEIPEFENVRVPPSLIMYTGTTSRGFPRERILALGDEGITWMGQPSRQGIALFSVRIEFWRSAASAWIVTLVIPGFNDSNDELTRLTEFLAGCRPRILRRCKWRSALQCR